MTQVMMAATVITGFTYYSLQSSTLSHQQVTNSASLQGVYLFRQSLLNNLNHDLAWTQTIAANSTMACLSPGSGQTCVPDGAPIEVRSGDGGVLVKTGSTEGFDWLGNSCTGFNSSSGNDNCPLRFEVRWGCASGVCEATSSDTPVALRPKIVIFAQLFFKPRTPSRFPPLNPEFLSVNNFLRGVSLATQIASADGRARAQAGTESVSPITACKSVGGFFDSSTQKCSPVRTINNTNNFCDSGQVFRGVDSSGPEPQNICVMRQGFFGSCVPGTAVVGYTESGMLICDSF